MSFLDKEKLYYLLPYQFQNFLISLYGQSLYRKRYGNPYPQLYREIENSEELSRPEVDNLQLNRLRDILQHAEKAVPYYRELFAKNLFTPSNLQSLDELKNIPILEKEEFRSKADRFVSTDKNDTSYYVQTTSGSSGKPVAIDVDEKTYKIAMGLVVYHEQFNGISFGARRATFAGRMIKRVEDNNPPFSRFNKAENQMLFSAYHIGPNNIHHYFSELNQFKPEEFIGYPSAMYSLAYEMRNAGLRLSYQPKLVVTNSETLLDWQRELIEAVFSCPVRDYYGTAEYLVFARQCSHQNYHINPLFGILEVVDDNDVPILEGEGEIVCTSLVNKRMPLIRYKVGDRAVISPERCGCGSALSYLTSIVGRVDDYVITVDGRRIGRLDHIYKKLTNIKEGQIIQTAKNECVVRLVKGPGDVAIDEKALVQNFEERVGADMHIRLEYVDEIKKGKNGKFKAVVNLIDGAARR